MAESALNHVHMLEERHFDNIKISIKSSSVLDTIAAYRLLSQRCDYPLHLGVTEAGGVTRGAVKSALGIGILLWEGIGDTIRVSLTADPVEDTMRKLKVDGSIEKALRLKDLIAKKHK